MDALKNIGSKLGGGGHGTTGATGTTGTTGGAGGGDALDKGVNAMGARSGHQMNAGTTEKVSDGIRTGFNKATGKDIPIKDQQYQ